jgi:CheY-like chemotaxis protein
VPSDGTTLGRPLWVTFRVRDEGPGLSAAQIGQLFRPFGQLRHGRQMADGSGLGLMITHSLVRKHGGRLWVSSEGDGRGSTFAFTVPLPMALATLPSSATSQAPSAGASRVGDANEGGADGAAPAVALSAAPTVSVQQPPAPLEAVRVLVVDDLAPVRDLMSRMLRRMAPPELPCRVLVDTAASGEEALERVAQGAPHLVLMDKEMGPGLDGYLTTTELRRRGFAGLVAGCTGHALAADQTAFLAHGADAVLTKPVARAEVVALVWRAASGARHEASAAAPGADHASLRPA